MLLGCLSLLGGCSQDGGKEYPVTYGDVTLDKEPEAIVVLNDSVADIISYIGYDIKMVGRAVTCDQDFLRIVPSVGMPNDPAIDTIVQKGADLVIADSTLSDKSRKKIEAEGITVITVDNATNQEEIKALYGDLGMILGGNVTGRAKGEEAYQELFELLDQFTTAVTGVVKTAAYLYLDDAGQLCTFTKGSLEQRIFNYNCATNAFNNQENPVVDLTELRLGSPNYIFYDDEAVIEFLRNDSDLTNLHALVNDQLYRIPKKNFFRYGTTMENTVYEMIDYLNKQDESTPDEQPTDIYGDPITEGEELVGNEVEQVTEAVSEAADDASNDYADYAEGE